MVFPRRGELLLLVKALCGNVLHQLSVEGGGSEKGYGGENENEKLIARVFKCEMYSWENCSRRSVERGAWKNY